jgi:hypothetical protein
VRTVTRAGALVLLAVLGGCATVPAPVATNGTSAAPRVDPAAGAATREPSGVTDAAVTDRGVMVGTTATGGRIVSRDLRPAVVDSGPSREALEVLATIPDPLQPSERVPPPEQVLRMYPVIDATPGAGAARVAATWVGAATGDAAAAPDSAAADSASAAASDRDTVDTVGVPVPEPTLPLGMRRPQVIPVIPDSVLRAARRDSAGRDSARRDSARADSAGAAARPGAAAATPAAAAAPGDSCWRVQVAAPEEADRAEQLRKAAESLLLVPMTVEKEKGLFKVRTRDCMSAANASNLKARAETSGFDGAFRFLFRKP